MVTPKGTTRGVWASAHSSSKMWRRTASQPGPPCSSGQEEASQPRAARMACQRSMSSFESSRFRRTFSESSGGSSSRRKARTSSRNASSSGE